MYRRYFERLKKIFCVYLSPVSAKFALTVKNVIMMIQVFFFQNDPFFVLGDLICQT